MKINRRWCFALGVLFLALGLGLVSPLAADAAGICEKALWACFTEPGHNLPWDILFCIQGYEFCKIYIEPYLNNGQ